MPEYTNHPARRYVTTRNDAAAQALLTTHTRSPAPRTATVRPAQPFNTSRLPTHVIFPAGLAVRAHHVTAAGPKGKQMQSRG